MRAAIAMVIILAGCYHPNEATGIPCAPNGVCPADQTCDTMQSPPTCIVGDAAAVVVADASIDAAQGCTGSTTCPQSAPVCDDQTHVCRRCIADADCPGVCLEYVGQCVAASDAIYVSPTGMDAGTCTSLLPCATLAFAVQQLTATRRTIRVGDGAYASSGSATLHVSNTNLGRVVVSGERTSPAGATLTASSNGTTNPPVVQTDSGTDVVIEGLTVQNGGQDGIHNNGALLLSHMDLEHNANNGLNSNPSTGAVQVLDSRIGNNANAGITTNGQNGTLAVLRTIVLHNAGGGIFIQKATATITNSMIVHNGTTTSSFGGLKLQNLNGLPQALAFDTIADNLASGTNIAGVQADSNASVAIDDSILTGNNADTSPQICPLCSATFSLFVGAAPIGSFQGAPDFVDPATDNYHLEPSSAARSAADPATTLRTDIDRQPRPQGPGFDIGADEIP